MAMAMNACRAPCTLTQRSCRALARPFSPISIRQRPMQQTAQQQHLAPMDSVSSRPSHICSAFNNDPEKQGSSVSGAKLEFNNAYAAITLFFVALLVFKNPYIYAVLSIITILPQNSAVTSLNNLVLFFYDSGLFVNFAEAVTAVRLVTWLSIIMTLVSFALFS